MGGHGGLNILPQKRWNVYNYENREKVRRDEEAAAGEEQLKREQSRKRDAEFRLERLRATRGLASTRPRVSEQVTEVPPHSSHLNLFEGLKEFDVVRGDHRGVVSEKGESNKKTKMKREEATPRAVTAEDEKYRLGYGVVGKGTKLPWYLERPETAVSESDGDDAIPPQAGSSTRKKSLQELRDERLRREKREKERQRALMQRNLRRDSSIPRNRESFRR